MLATGEALRAVQVAQEFIHNTTAPFSTFLANLPLLQSISALSHAAVGAVDRVDLFVQALEDITGQAFKQAMDQVRCRGHRSVSIGGRVSCVCCRRPKH